MAARYDEDLGSQDPDAAVALLAGLAFDGRALELAIGTGRVALPLAAAGIEVHGIELSPQMVAGLRAKEGGAAIPVTLGDMAETSIDDRFSLVFLLFNTITNLTTQRAQAACFRNAARHLVPGGSFLVETFVPPLQRLPPGETCVAFSSSQNHWGIDEIDVATQAMVSHHFRMRDGRLEKTSIPFRYVWPSELDLMAEAAGLELKSRWGSWQKEDFTAQSRSHVSLWQKP
ncbi:MAG: class I SAM-dependent methyltransferase [Pseudomonadota bacterium]